MMETRCSVRTVMTMMMAGLCTWLPLIPPTTCSFATQLFAKVTNPTFPSLSGCSLTTETVPNKLTCAAYCHRTPTCTMFCLSGTTCSMYKARVGRNWAGEGTTHSGTCYTSWGSEIMASASIAASISYTASYDSTKAINGFYCNTLTQCYCSVSMANAYLAISIGSQQLVNAVRIQTFSSYFNNIEVSVGNSTDYSNGFSDNILLGNTLGSVSSASVVTFQQSQPIQGSIVSFLQKDTTYFCMCDIEINVT